jgi:hypothetical protein
MYSATPQKPLESGPPYMAAIITLLVLLAMVLLALMVLARKRKISAPVWFPPSTIGADSKSYVLFMTFNESGYVEATTR